MVNDFFYKQPVRIWFGEGKFQQLESVMAELGCKKCVLVCGRHFAPEAKAMMEKMPAIAAVYGEVEQNPQLAGVEETVRLARSLGADTIVGIGGGSSMDTAKFAAAAAPGTESAEAYYTGAAAFPGHPLTIIAVPTTAGTGAEVTQVSVMSRGSEKRTINRSDSESKSLLYITALTAGGLVMCAGYLIAERLMYGNWAAAFIALPWNFGQFTAGIVFSLLISHAMPKFMR